jgi:Flp pilus assembly protein TadG
MVELALLLPVLVMILLAIIKFGIAINNYVVLTNAVRTGARTLAVGRGSADPCASAITRVKNSASDLDTSKLTVTTSYGSVVDVSSCPSGGTPMVAGDDATLRASYPCDLTILGIDFALGQCTISSRTTERIE